MRSLTFEGSVRVDLLGGTIDLPPINLVINNVVTLNVATSLKAKVIISENNFPGVIFKSLDYKEEVSYPSENFCEEDFRKGTFKHFEFLARICKSSGITKNISLELQSGSPPGAGLGGSSAMGISLYQALRIWKNEEVKSELERESARLIVQGIESIILDAGPAGYQDYYPALYGGILALHGKPERVDVEQLYSKELSSFLEEHLLLVYSGETRNSGINNWEVYKGFFDKKKEIRTGLNNIANLSYQAYQNIKADKFENLLSLIGQEGEERQKLFPSITTKSMRDLFCHSSNLGVTGLKVCGAGGGGCFLLTLKNNLDRFKIEELITSRGMKVMPFKINAPL